MKCPYCQTETKLYRQTFSNGTKHITERCPNCKRLPVPNRPFLPNYHANIDALPEWGGETEQPQLFTTKAKPQPIYHRLDLRKQ